MNPGFNLLPQSTTPSHSDNPTREAFKSRVEALCAWRLADGNEGALREFQRCHGRAPDATLDSRGWRLLLGLSRHTALGHDPTERVVVVLHGELLNEEGTSPEWVAEQYLRRGESLFPELNGSFALILLDRAEDRLFVIPDRSGSRRLFHSRGSAGHHVTSDLRAQPTDHRPLDILGVGWFLATGIPFDGRTPYEGIRVLPRAHVHELRPDGMESREYWSHGIREPDGPVDEGRLSAGLQELMVQAVRRCADPERDLYLSLSGGYDSIGIASVLGQTLGRKDVRTYSYVHGDVRPGLDAFVAEQVAAELGFAHRSVQSYRGDLLSHLRTNAEMTEAGAMAAYEVDMWQELGPELAAANAPIVLVGEERMGYSGSMTVETVNQLWQRARFKELYLPPTVSRSFPSGLLQRINEAIHEEVRSIIERQPGSHALNVIRFQIGFDQRIVHQLLPWRERYIGAHATVRNPWLDADVLDFMADVPNRLLIGKTLYRRALAELAPNMAAIPKAEREGYRADWRAEIRSHADDLAQWINASDSRLDELIPPSFGLALLDEVLEAPSLRRTWYGVVRRVEWRLRRAGVLPARLPWTAPHNVFREWAILRMALED
jgi:asparagine synthase (glutamine-hydrolysing)